MDLEIDEIPESLAERTVPKRPAVNVGFLQSLMITRTVEMRAEAAHTGAIKFLKLLKSEFPDEDEYRRLMMNFLRAIKDDNFRKFSRVLARAERDKKSGNLNTVPETSGK